MRSACWTFKGSNVLKSRPSAQSSMKLAFVSHLCHDLPHATQRARHSSFLNHRSGRLWLASFRHLLLVIVALGLLAGQSGNAQPPFPFTPPPPPKPFPLVSQIFGDNMVLQRGKTSTLWGWADAGDKIPSRSATGVRPAWPALTAFGRRRFSRRARRPLHRKDHRPRTDESVELHNVLVGDVWLCGGQSNMELSLRGMSDAGNVIKAANYPEIRFFTVAALGYQPTPPCGRSLESSFAGNSGPAFSRRLFLCAQRSSRIFMFPSAWLWTRRRNSRGGLDKRAALNRCLGLRYPAGLSCSQRLAAAGGPNTATTSCTGTIEYDIGSKEKWAAPIWMTRPGRRSTFRGDFPDSVYPTILPWPGSAERSMLPDPLPAGRVSGFTWARSSASIRYR